MPIARSKSETKWEGEALPRQSRREDSSAWRLHVAHIEKEIERVVTHVLAFFFLRVAISFLKSWSHLSSLFL